VSSKLGTPLPTRSPAWYWVVVLGFLAVYLAWKGNFGLSATFAGIAIFIALLPRFRKPELETIQVDDSGVLRIDGEIKERISWDSVEEVRIITTDKGPYQEDVFFVLADSNGSGCLIPHDAAVRTKLLQELQVRFPGLDDDMAIKAMGSTSDNSFLLWKKTHGA
jgi:hypothetical protein